MNSLLTSHMPFPPISWWGAASDADQIYFDQSEGFRKMTLRNRYYIAGANGLIRLSVPILEGREQRLPMQDIRISQDTNWQVQHWRALISAYRRAPFFQHYEAELQALFHPKYKWLIDFNQASFIWLQERLPLPTTIHMNTLHTPESGYRDLRNIRRANTSDWAQGFPTYQQVFSDRTGFIPDLSLLDLFFAEGPSTMRWLRQHINHLLQSELVHIERRS